MMRFIRVTLASLLACVLGNVAKADFVEVTVTIQNLAPTNGVSFAPLRLGFHKGTYDAFNNGQTAGAAIISVAEGGSASDWFPAFAAADPTATLGSVGGALLPGRTASNTFLVDTDLNPFFTFGSMVIPSNDLFIGNDSPTRFRLFDGNGQLLISSIGQKGRDIWDAGSEVADPLNAAFVVGGVNANRTPQDGVVSFSFSELGVFDRVNTAGGYVYNNSLLTNDSDIYQITFEAQAVPAPPAVLLAVVGVFGVGLTRRFRRNTAAVAG